MNITRHLQDLVAILFISMSGCFPAEQMTLNEKHYRINQKTNEAGDNHISNYIICLHF